LLDWLKALGLPTPPRVRPCPDLAAVHAAITELDTLRHGFAFETDGAVIKLNDRTLYARLGTTAKAPRWARAFKYPPDQAETVVEAITVQVGRTGVLTPVAELRTVRLAGSDISRATLHNEDEIRRKDVRIGDHVLIEKAGEVIPAVVRVLPEKRTGAEIVFAMPKRCPACAGPVARRADEVALRCANFLCPAQLVARLTHFASRDALDLKGLGDEVAEALVEQRCIRDPLDLFDPSQTAKGLSTLRFQPKQSPDAKVLTPDPEQLPLPGDISTHVKKHKPPTLGDDRAKDLIDARELSRSLPLARWLFAIGIPAIGTESARLLASFHRDFRDLANSVALPDIARLYDLQDEAKQLNPRSDAFQSLGIAERVTATERHSVLLDQIEVLGESLVSRKLAKRDKKAGVRFTSPITPEICRAVYEFFLSDAGRTMAARLAALGINPVSETPPAEDGPLTGRTYVITGHLASSSRPDAAKRLRERGALVAESVTRETTALIAGDKPGDSKMKRALELSVPVLTETDYLKLLASNGSSPASSPSNTGPDELF
jgi:DNA ligase (NAD+)